jgi:VIT1/CCC1 family predicted Fe2+/Mn2+ transporter
MMTDMSKLSEHLNELNEQADLNEGSEKYRKPIEAIAKKVQKMMSVAEKIEMEVEKLSDKMTAKLNKDNLTDEALQVETQLLDVGYKAQDLYQAIDKAQRELWNISSRF